MNKQQVVKRIIRIPEEFYHHGGISFEKLIAESGYLNYYETINEFDIYEGLILNSGYTDYWMQFSNDKRTSTGWYIKQDEFGQFEVGFIDCSNVSNVKKFDEVKGACAFFIVKELEQIRMSIKK